MNRRQHLRMLVWAPMLQASCASSRPAATATHVDTGVLVRPCHSQPGQLQLPYRHHHRGIAGRPVGIFLGGGPGVSNLGFRPPESWLDVMDVLVLEYRGVGECRPVLGSRHFVRALNQPISRLGLDGAVPLKAGLAQGFDALRRQGVAFEDFGLSALADDIEALRQQLRLPPLILVAHSFGTRIAQMMQTRHRASVHGSLLLSANTPGGLIWFPDDTQSVWHRWCASAEARQSGLAEPVARLLTHGWDRQGQWHTNDSRALILSFFMSFNRSTRLRAMQTILAAEQGSSALWWAMGQGYALFTRFSFNWADFFVKGYVIDADREALAASDQQGHRALFQSPSALLFSGIDGFEAAGGRREPQPPVDYRNTLLVTGEFDPSTPIERWPAEVPPVRRIILPGEGHAEALQAALRNGQPWLRSLTELPHTDSTPS
ncbi:MAG: alpha/beta hydrolase [Lautropia sp.]|nr:alpha/beta hydrolase [Lautropia sp.]